MRLTRYSDYSLRVLMYLAVKGETLSTIQEIADRYDISKSHLTKVVHNLQRNGYVTTLRGKGGGLRLARGADRISVGQVVRDMEPDMELVECFGNGNRCVITPHCGLAAMLDEALAAFLAVLDAHTLEDLMTERRGLSRRLKLPVALAPRR